MLIYILFANMLRCSVVSLFHSRGAEKATALLYCEALTVAFRQNPTEHLV